MRVAILASACCLCAIASTAICAAENREQATKLLVAAQADYKQGKYSSAYESANACVTAGGDHPQAAAIQLLAMICHRSGRLEEALKHGRRYLRLVDRAEFQDIPAAQSSRQDIAILLGDICQELGKPAEAAAWFQSALAIAGGKQKQRPAWPFEVQLRLAKLKQTTGTSEDESQKKFEKIAQLAEQRLRAADVRTLPIGARAGLVHVRADAFLAAGRLADARTALETLANTQTDPADQAATLIRLADVARRLSDVDFNVKVLQRAIDIQQKRADGSEVELMRLMGQQASALDQLATRQPERAEQLRKLAGQRRLKIARWSDELQQSSKDKDPFEQISCQQQLIEVARDLADWPAARTAAEELLRLRTQVLLPDDPNLYRTMTALGTFEAKCREFAKGRVQLLRALEYWQRHEPRAEQELGDALQNLAEVAREEGQYGESRQYFQQALQAFDRAGVDLDHRLESRIGLANVLSAEGRYHQAIEQFADAEDLARRAPAGGDDETRRLLSRALLGRAIVYRMHLAQLHLAIDDCEEALKLFRSTAASSPLDEVPYLATRATLHLARYEAEGCLLASPDLQLARDSIEQAYRLTAEEVASESAERCQVLHVLGVIRLREAQASFREGGDRDLVAAARFCDQALKLWREAAEIGTTAIQARSLCYMSEAHLLAFDRSLPIEGQSRDTVLDSALTQASEATERLEKMQVYPGLYYRALLVRAKVLRRQARQLRESHRDAEALDKLDLAIADLKNATSQVEAPRFASLGADAERAEFFSQFVEAYELLVTCLVQRERFDEALAYSQISRNRTFIEQVLVSEEDLRAELEPLGKASLLPEMAKVAQLRDRLKADSQRALDHPGQSNDLAQLRQDLAAAQRQYDRLSGEIRSVSGAYRNLLDGGLRPEDWTRARQQILQRNEAMLVYHLGDSGSYLFVVDSDHAAPVKLHQLWITNEVAEKLGVPSGPLTSAVARRLVQHYLWRRGTAPVRGGATQAQLPRPLTIEQSLVLSELILPSRLRTELRELKPSALIVVPDGPLHELPLESLVLSNNAGRTEYLLDDDELPPLSYSPSAMVLAALESRSADQTTWPTVLTVGNPTNATMARLPNAAKECEAWRQWLAAERGQNVQSLVGDQATKKNVVDGIAKKNLVHFAVHGIVDRRFDDVFAASLLLTPASGDEGRLFLQDVYRFPLRDCRLAVLSACQSNIGAARKLEAGSTLTRAFLSAGAQRVVSSLWPVDDEATLALMSDFIETIGRSVAQGAPPNYAQALQHARRRVKQTKGDAWQDPYYWAPFVLVGPAQ